MKKLISLFLVGVLSLSVMIFDVSAAKVNTVSISGEELFDEAFSIYDEINRARVSKSRSKVVMDKELNSKFFATQHCVIHKFFIIIGYDFRCFSS